MKQCNIIVSIIIPAYNVTEYLADCLDSVMAQDVDNSIFEVIVVDDYSPYGEKEIVDKYLSKYDNVRYIRHDINKPQGGARNTGIRAAHGEYVMFLDADDCIIYTNTLSILSEYVDRLNPVVLRTEKYAAFSSEIRYRDFCDRLGYTKEYKNEKIELISRSFVEWRSGKMSCSVCGSLYKRSFLLEHNLFFRENVLFEDTDWTQKTLFYAKTIDFIEFPFYGYRQSLNSTTRGHSISSFEGAVEGVIETYRFYESIKITNEFRSFIHEKIIDNTIGFLKFSRNYPIKSSLRMLNKINDSGLTSLKSTRGKDSILFIMRNVPLLPLVIVKLGSFFKRSVVSLLTKINYGK